MKGAVEARCPQCGNPATEVPLSGWLFLCNPCGQAWGHPQTMTRVAAREALHEAKTGEADDLT